MGITISSKDLNQHDGELKSRMYVAYAGIVYDVTDCPKWRTGLHENTHFPGQELTEELDINAPHGEEVFRYPCVKKVGILSREF